MMPNSPVFIAGRLFEIGKAHSDEEVAELILVASGLLLKADELLREAEEDIMSWREMQGESDDSGVVTEIRRLLKGEYGPMRPVAAPNENYPGSSTSGPVGD